MKQVEIMKKLNILILLLSIAATGLFAQKGALSGTILDGETGETLIGANVVIAGTAIGTSTDFDGKYQFQADPGTYNIVISYIGYSNKQIDSVEIKANETTFLDVTMGGEEAVQLDLDVVVTAKVIERTENALLMLQKKSDKIQDGISSQEIARLGAGNAASALKKVTGTTVVDGKYIFVRGLGDRYSATTINGIRLPSIDPYRNSAQLDLIPSNFLDNIIASKTFTPDLPGNFTGGSVDIKTKSLPERFTYSISVSGSYNSQTSFEDNFLTFDAGDNAGLGFSDETLEFPSILNDPGVQEALALGTNAPIFASIDPEVGQNVDQAVKALNNDFAFDTQTAPISYSISASIGNQFDLGGMPLGLLFTLNYSRDYSFVGNAVNAFYDNQGVNVGYLDRYLLNETRATEKPVIGGLFGLSLKPNPNNEIRFYSIYSHQTEITGRDMSGTHQEFGIFSPQVFNSRTFEFLERGFLDYILSGEHVFPGLNNLRLEWSGSYVDSEQNEPDLRFLADTFRGEQQGFAINSSQYDDPSHFFRELSDETLQGKIDITIPFLQDNSKSNKIKAGGYYSTLDRNFTENRFLVFSQNSSAAPYDGNAAKYFDDSNLGLLDDGSIGLYALDQTIENNSYSGTTTISAAYAMVTYQVVERLKVIAGARFETTLIEVDAAGEDESDDSKLDESDLLPSINLIFSLNDNSNLRASFSNTLARPNMREIAPFGSFSSIGEAPVFGNPELVLTRINNFDLRYEVFPKAGELYAASVFYKSFEDAIARTFRAAGNAQYTWRNIESAFLYGIELEARKSLDFIGPAFENFNASANFTYIFSESDLDSEELELNRDVDPEFPETRTFPNQSPFVVNFNISYVDIDNGIDAILAFNYFDDRLFTTGAFGTRDVFERGRGTLDFSVSKKFGKVDLKLRARNLLNPDYEYYSDFDDELIYGRFQRGVDISLGVTYSL